VTRHARAALLLAALALCSCKPKPPELRDGLLKQAIVHGGAAVFRSHDGRPFGMDGDVDVAFFPDSTAAMLRYSATLTCHWGVFAIGERDTVMTDFPSSQEGWPLLVVVRDGDALWLQPDAEQPSKSWPFRLLSGEDSQRSLENVRQTCSP
jgi:hypothetical protein